MTQRRQITFIITMVLLLGISLGCVALLLLPNLLESKILPRIARQIGLPSLKCRINHLGFTKASAGPLSLGETSKPDITIEQITLFYNPSSIKKGELEKVALCGVSIKTIFSKGTITIPGLEEIISQSSQNKTNAEKNVADSAANYRVPVPPFAELTIERSVINHEINGRNYRIPFSLHIKKSAAFKPEAHNLYGSLKIYPQNTPVTLKIKASLDKKVKLHLSLKADDVNLLKFTNLLQTFPTLALKGQLTLDADADISLSPLKFEAELEGRCTTHLSGRYKTLIWTKPLRKNWLFRASINPQGAWQANLESPADNASWEIGEEDATIGGNSPAIFIKASGFGEKGEIECCTTLERIVLRDTNKHFKCPTIRVETRLNFASAPPQIKTLLQLQDGTLQAPEYGLQIRGLNLNLPWIWPANGTILKEKGELNCQKIFFKDFELGQFAASLKQKAEKIILKGRYESALFKGLHIITTGECRRDRNGELQVSGSFKLPPFRPEKPINLGNFSKTAKNNLIDGIFSARGTLAFAGQDLSGSATANLKEATFSNPEKKLECCGISFNLHFPELPSLRSGPNQKLVFEQLKAGNIVFNNGNLAFQIEPQKTLLLEKGQLAWCGGSIETQALRISPTIDSYQSTLYCDRLQLAELLKQLGQIEAYGQGSVNGRIPLAWRNRKLTFNDGFLYSTPGQGGIIKITDDNSLITGLPSSDPQFAQLDLAREALKDYQYQWTKMKLNSEADELILNLQFDGKPRLPLPFIYKKEIGSFSRITANHPGSNFQGINLDINLRLPLNRILQYKELSTMLE